MDLPPTHTNTLLPWLSHRHDHFQSRVRRHRVQWNRCWYVCGPVGSGDADGRSVQLVLLPFLLLYRKKLVFVCIHWDFSDANTEMKREKHLDSLSALVRLDSYCCAFT